MDINIKNKTENKLYDRTEVDFILSYTSSTPKRKEIVDKLASLLNAKNDLIVLNSLENEFGKKEAKGRAHIYKNEEKMKDFENEYLLKRLKPKEEKKA